MFEALSRHVGCRMTKVAYILYFSPLLVHNYSSAYKSNSKHVAYSMYVMKIFYVEKITTNIDTNSSKHVWMKKLKTQ